MHKNTSSTQPGMVSLMFKFAASVVESAKQMFEELGD
ncbi:MAG: hypothetical protein ACI83Q_000146 [Colwellia polaris]|jgi:hypothetical protein